MDERNILLNGDVRMTWSVEVQINKYIVISPISFDNSESIDGEAAAEQLYELAKSKAEEAGLYEFECSDLESHPFWKMPPYWRSFSVDIYPVWDSYNHVAYEFSNGKVLDSLMEFYFKWRLEILATIEIEANNHSEMLEKIDGFVISDLFASVEAHAAEEQVELFLTGWAEYFEVIDEYSDEDDDY